jgi:hypothetical protein
MLKNISRNSWFSAIMYSRSCQKSPMGRNNGHRYEKKCEALYVKPSLREDRPPSSEDRPPSSEDRREVRKTVNSGKVKSIILKTPDGIYGG